MSKPLPIDVERFVREKDEPFATTTDVLEEFPNVTRRTINKRLNQLYDEGRIEKREIGANSVVWYTID